jgi:segregation and condensation protein B
MSEQQNVSDYITIRTKIEALIFTASGPVSAAQLAIALEEDVVIIEQALRELDQTYREGHGLRLQWFNGKVQLTTAPELAPWIERFLGLENTSRLSRASLETLSIIAYQQPVTRPQVDAIRGVSSDGSIRSLLNKGLAQEIGRTDGPGRPILYGTTPDFLQYFGLSSIQELPPLETLNPAEPGKSQPLLKD